MTPAERHHELDRLRTLWTDAIHIVRAARPGTIDWAQGRVLERRAAAEYMRELLDPYQDADAAGTPASGQKRPIEVHVLPAGEALALAEELGREFEDVVAASDSSPRPDVSVHVVRTARHVAASGR